jgi:D-alanyl-D-alanine carboxypeptidase
MPWKRIVLFLLLLIVIFVAFHNHSHTQNIKHPSSQSSSFNKQQYSKSDPNSIWVVVNKKRPLSPKEYAPSDLVIPNVPLRYGRESESMQLRKPAATALEAMVKDGDAAGMHLMLASGYRSYATQVNTYASEVNAYGQATADSESARPGYSEHQTGLAMDLEDAGQKCEVQDCFGSLPEGKWAATNAYKYGFIMRYPPNKEEITGYRYESWHFRYVGVALATELHKDHIETLEQFFGLPAAPDY